MGEAIVYGIKVGLAIACAVGFFAAVVVLMGLFQNFTAPALLNEVMGLISIYLPFSPSAVVTAFMTVATGVVAFLIARKIYQATTELHKSS